MAEATASAAHEAKIQRIEQIQDPSTRANLLARATIMRSLKTSPDNLGLSETEIAAVRKYARAAGEQAGKEAESLVAQSPVERLDQILFDASQSLPEGGLERANLIWASRGLHDIARGNQEVVLLEQQRREMNGEPSTLDGVEDELIAKEHHTGPTLKKISGVGALQPNQAESMLRELGAIPKDGTLDGLRSSDRWGKLSSDFDRRVGYSPTPLETGISDLRVEVAERVNTYPQPGEAPTLISVDYHFGPKTLKSMLKAPLGQSVFDSQQSSAPQATPAPVAV